MIGLLACILIPYFTICGIVVYLNNKIHSPQFKAHDILKPNRHTEPWEAPAKNIKVLCVGKYKYQCVLLDEKNRIIDNELAVFEESFAFINRGYKKLNA